MTGITYQIHNANGPATSRKRNTQSGDSEERKRGTKKY